MTGVAWAALGAGVALLPGPPRALLRADALRRRAQQSPIVAESSTGPADLRRVLGVVCVVAVVITTLVAGPVLGVAAGIAVAMIAASVSVARNARAAQRREQDLVGALHLLAAELSSGSLPGQALRAAADACPAHRAALSATADAVARGDPPEFGAGALVPLGRAWQVASGTGAPLADVVGRVAEDLSARITRRREVSAAVAGARSSAALLAVLPVLGLLLGAAMQAHPLDVLFGSAAGRLLCVVGVALDACGLAWTHRLAVRAQRP